MKLVGLQIDAGHLFGRDFSAERIFAAVQAASYSQPLGGRGAGDQPDDRFIVAQRFSAPVGGDEGEEAVFDFVPFAGSGGEVADGNFQTGLVGQALEFPFPKTDAIAVAASSVGGNEQACAPGV